MPWLRVDDGLFLHPKWLAVPPPARGLWITALSYCGNQSNGGVVPSPLLPLLGGTVKDAESLVAAGLWTAGDDCWHVHDFGSYNDQSTPEAKAERSTKRSAAARQAGLASAAKRQRSANDGSTFDQRLVNDDSTLANEHSTIGQPNPTPSPSPSPSPNGVYRTNGQQRGLTARPRVASMDTELDRPPAMSETDRRVARAMDLANRAWSAENDRDQAAIDAAFDNVNGGGRRETRRLK